MKNGSLSPANPPPTANPADVETARHGCTKEKRKKIIIAVAVIGIILLVIGLFYLGFSVKVETCTTSQCVRTAAEIRKYIDTRTDPCDDFYRFSCGSFLQNTNIQNTQGQQKGSRSVEDITKEEILLQLKDMLQAPIRSEDSKAFNVAKKFYRACLNETAIAREGLEKIKQIFELIGGWPTLKGYNWKEETFDWTEALHKLRELGLNFDVFFRITVDRDQGGERATRGSRYILQIHEIPYSQMEFGSEVKSMVFEYMVQLSVRFGANRDTAQQDAREVLRLFQELSRISKESRIKNTTKDDYERLALSELQYKYPEIKWHFYINGLLKPAEHFNYDDEIIVVQPRYVEMMEVFLGVTAKRSLANIICWHTLQYLISYMPVEIIEQVYELVERINGEMMNFRVPRWKTCVQEAKIRLSPVLSAAYIQNFFPEEKRYKVLTMVRAIKKQFEENLFRVEWMDYETKEITRQKLHASGEKLASYGDLLNLLEDNKIFGQVVVNQAKFLDAVLNLNLVNFYLMQSKLREYYEEDSFNDIDFISGLEVKYSSFDNILTFPVGIFSGIYYQNDRPEYMNYGILGSIIAHEVSHIFMRAQHGDSPHGELRSWWSTNSLANYDEKLQCLSNQYGKFRVTKLNGKHLSQERIHDEDMADLAGIKVSYDTYNTYVRQNGAQPLLSGLKYSPNQLFWISAAIRHCSKDSPEGLDRYHENYQRSPNQVRINGAMQNLKEFAFDFGCRKDSKMNPEHKCVVW
ncbi:unnamed protein product [Psylliodes chrysocephalus]|uniref:Uncharacterized protein n=1 Tax=Psylliodes chrysocephalus TaxID=3402493 RepID=A0A9P0D7K5_9CUCU|nr:unnamed protein product [Psylliodes chrysocephala]